MGGNNLLHDIQTESGASGLRRIQRLENGRQLGGGNAAPGILHLQVHMRRGALSSNDKDATLWHGIERVLHEIQERSTQRMGMKGHLADLQSVEAEPHALGRRQRLPLDDPCLDGVP